VVAAGIHLSPGTVTELYFVDHEASLSRAHKMPG
jgi:hypothetical protein